MEMPYVWWKYIEDMFVICEHGEESLKLFTEQINSVRPTIEFTADWSYSSVNFLDVKVFRDLCLETLIIP